MRAGAAAWVSLGTHAFCFVLLDLVPSWSAASLSPTVHLSQRNQHTPALLLKLIFFQGIPNILLADGSIKLEQV
jgi:hypothetical protein